MVLRCRWVRARAEWLVLHSSILRRFVRLQILVHSSYRADASKLLETRGIYSVIRNPSYLGMLVTSLGWVLAFRSGVGVLLALSLLIPLPARIRAEERLLGEHFGAEYDAYVARTWRLVPGIY